MGINMELDPSEPEMMGLMMKLMGKATGVNVSAVTGMGGMTGTVGIGVGGTNRTGGTGSTGGKLSALGSRGNRVEFCVAGLLIFVLSFFMLTWHDRKKLCRKPAQGIFLIQEPLLR